MSNKMSSPNIQVKRLLVRHCWVFCFYDDGFIGKDSLIILCCDGE